MDPKDLDLPVHEAILLMLDLTSSGSLENLPLFRFIMMVDVKEGHDELIAEIRCRQSYFEDRTLQAASGLAIKSLERKKAAEEERQKRCREAIQRLT